MIIVLYTACIVKRFYLVGLRPNYSRISIARTPMARSPWLIQTRFCPYEILPIDQENKYLRKLSYFKAILMSTLNIQLLCRRSIDFPELAGAMINFHWLELPMVRTIFHDPKGVRAIEVRL